MSDSSVQLQIAVSHAAFHTPMQEPVAAQGRAALPRDLFGQPDLPLVDGHGRVWWPGASDVQALLTEHKQQLQLIRCVASIIANGINASSAGCFR